MFDNIDLEYLKATVDGQKRVINSSDYHQFFSGIFFDNDSYKLLHDGDVYIFHQKIPMGHLFNNNVLMVANFFARRIGYGKNLIQALKRNEEYADYKSINNYLMRNSTILFEEKVLTLATTVTSSKSENPYTVSGASFDCVTSEGEKISFGHGFNLFVKDHILLDYSLTPAKIEQLIDVLYQKLKLLLEEPLVSYYYNIKGINLYLELHDYLSDLQIVNLDNLLITFHQLSLRAISRSGARVSEKNALSEMADLVILIETILDIALTNKKTLETTKKDGDRKRKRTI